MLSFGERLRRARKRKGMTQIQVMNVTNISDKSLSRYENGASAPDPDTILKLIHLYDVSADYIMGLSPEMGHSANTTTLVLPNNESYAIYEAIIGLSDKARKKVEEYIEMLQTLEDVKSNKMVDFKKKA